MNKSFCPYCGNPELTDAIPPRYGCNRPVDAEKDFDLLERIHLNCMHLELLALRSLVKTPAPSNGAMPLNEKKEFEAEAQQLICPSLLERTTSTLREAWEKADYKNHVTMLMWKTWQARAALSGVPQPPAPDNPQQDPEPATPPVPEGKQ